MKGLRAEIKSATNMADSEREFMIRADIVAILLGYGYELCSARHLSVQMLETLRKCDVVNSRKNQS
jgi:hypothetical protein